MHHLTDIYTHAPLAKSPRHTTSPHCYETATSLRITFPTSCGMHVFPFSETKEWHLSLSQKRPLAIPPPLCKIWTPTKSLSTFSRGWHLLSPLGKYSTAKNNFPLICLVITDPSYSPIPLPAAQHKDCHSALTRQIATATGCCHQVAFATSCSSNSIFPQKETLQCNPFESYKHFNKSTWSLVIVILYTKVYVLWQNKSCS